MSSKNTGNSRRDFLLKTIAIAPAVALNGTGFIAMSAPVQASESKPSQSADVKAPDYHPTKFTAEEYAFLQAAVARLIPADDRGPGALEAGVPEYIDRQMDTPYATGANWYMQGPFNPEAEHDFGYQLPLGPFQIYQLGIADANDYAKTRFGKVFNQLNAEQQETLLTEFESGKAEFKQVPSKVFFSFLLQNTREGFFCDPIHGGNNQMVGWKLIGFPGARADFMDWVERGERYPFPPVSISGERA
ncbi:gluconate 2-dehydrogenase subunit 3 family protein [Rouxiella chamberiensis]|uniref:Gluconate 2-dehydrogenase subunit 3 family protein n=1 Tax=Rouxiella chamberiensis TaxID=1513468 RepID=A0ABY7HPL4_9GAMM|nr:gluconate 2-dehydrogenase subunit 3 family protein [Rouxiella chamberiensis]WAT01178.1 gluconate 2-dehydrogenase subunit 3 family protein [Rouxiella chamberiensis]